MKKFGQNFLTNIEIAEREIRYANISKNDIVLEIGPGKGILTNILSKKAKKVIAIEIDKRLIKELKEKDYKNVDIIYGDVLKIDFSRITKFNKIVSNLPYQISSPVTFKILEYSFDTAVLIYQKEFAERMIAEPGSKDYSRLTINVYYKAKCEYLETISKNFFKPTPKVDSALIRIKPRKTPPFKINDEELFFSLVNLLFSQRRKKIKTILKEKYNINNMNIPYADNRVEQLNPEEIADLSNIVKFIE